MLQHYLRFPLLALVAGALSGPGQSAQAESGQQYAQTVQGCEFGGFPGYFVRIETNGDDLAIRSAPAGAVVGAVPNGWAVRVLEWSRNSYWVRITSQYAYAGDDLALMSAPNFREGWVSAGYVKDLGRFCDKPLEAAELVQPEIFGDRPVQVQGDWLAMVDQLAQNLH